MKRTIAIGCNILSAIIVAGQFGVWNSLLLFLLIGRLPGTEYTISPSGMLMLYLLICLAAVAVVLRARTNSEPTPTLPKRRYSKV